MKYGKGLLILFLICIFKKHTYNGIFIFLILINLELCVESKLLLSFCGKFSMSNCWYIALYGNINISDKKLQN